VQVGVFDTAFHQTMPPAAYMYALPYQLYQQQGVRRFGMHGTSYRFLLGKAAEHLKKPKETLNLISAHLGEPYRSSAGVISWCMTSSTSILNSAMVRHSSQI
jgi:acetate kinase